MAGFFVPVHHDQTKGVASGPSETSGHRQPLELSDVPS
jgi:hypothetical protein